MIHTDAVKQFPKSRSCKLRSELAEETIRVISAIVGDLLNLILHIYPILRLLHRRTLCELTLFDNRERHWQ
jgi:hypothetical protein